MTNLRRSNQIVFFVRKSDESVREREIWWCAFPVSRYLSGCLLCTAQRRIFLHVSHTRLSSGHVQFVWSKFRIAQTSTHTALAYTTITKRTTAAKPFNHIIIIFINRPNEIFVCVYNLIRLHSLSCISQNSYVVLCGCWIDSRLEFHYWDKRTLSKIDLQKAEAEKYNFVPILYVRLLPATDMCAFGVNFEPFILALSDHSNSKCDPCVVRAVEQAENRRARQIKQELY